jgi:GntR family transcriptional regulator, rspAB operon transcriptional repressor
VDGKSNGGGAGATAAGVEHAYQGVRNAIIGGRLRPGQLIPQIALAKLLNVSRTPLREALRLLQAEGLIEAQANQPMRVARLTLDGVEDLYAMRIPLEVAALRLSVPQLTEADFEQLEGLLARMRRLAAARDYGGWDEPHRRFHHMLTDRAGERFSILLSQLIDQCARFRRMRVAHMWSDETELEHRALLDACLARDADRAGWLLAQHLGETALALLRTVDPEHPGSKLQALVAQVPRPADVPTRAYHHLTVVAAA